MAKRVDIPSSQYLSGLNAVVDKLNKAIQQAEEQTITGAKGAATRVIAVAAQRAPLDAGDLRRSGTVKDPVYSDGYVEIEMGFYEPYAAEQHEHTEYGHKEGQAKYLESAIIDNESEILRRIAGEALNQ